MRRRTVVAGRDEAKDVIVRDLFRETDAARTEDAALIIERDSWTELNIFRLLHLVLEETRILATVFNAEFLETAFAGLVADRAIERVINEEEFHYPAAAFLNQRGVGAHSEPFGNIGRAANLRTRHPIDFGRPSASRIGFRSEPIFGMPISIRHMRQL
jgi:hypothetical protein